MTQPYRLAVNLDWQKALEGVPVSYANEFMVQQWRDKFIISAAQVTPPGLVNPTQEQVDAITSIAPTVISRFVVDPSDLKIFVGRLTAQLEDYELRLSQGSQASDGEPES